MGKDNAKFGYLLLTIPMRRSVFSCLQFNQCPPSFHSSNEVICIAAHFAFVLYYNFPKQKNIQIKIVLSCSTLFVYFVLVVIFCFRSSVVWEVVRSNGCRNLRRRFWSSYTSYPHPHIYLLKTFHCDGSAVDPQHSRLICPLAWSSSKMMTRLAAQFASYFDFSIWNSKLIKKMPL